MSFNEIITIYLAIGAPFGVHYVFQHKIFNWKLFFKAIIISFLWPLIVVRYFAHLRMLRADSNINSDKNEMLEHFKRNLFAALNEIRTHIQGIKEKENIERLVCVIRENIEKYSGLSIVSISLYESDEAFEHEFEIYRITGCKGDELKTAVCCLHRRNVRRIKEHRKRARNNLMHALIEIEESLHKDNGFLLMNSEQPRQINESLHRLYSNAIEILLLIEDKNAVATVTRLLDKTSARLQVFEAESADDKQEDIGEEECLRTVHRHLAQTSQ